MSIDPNTGRIRPITADEARQLVVGMSELYNRTMAADAATYHPDGMISLDISGLFHNVYLARINPDGSVGQACVDGADAAVGFFQGGSAVVEDK